MEDHGVKFVRGAVPVSIEKVQDGTPGLYKVKKCILNFNKYSIFVNIFN